MLCRPPTRWMQEPFGSSQLVHHFCIRGTQHKNWGSCQSQTASRFASSGLQSFEFRTSAPGAFVAILEASSSAATEVFSKLCERLRLRSSTKHLLPRIDNNTNHGTTSSSSLGPYDPPPKPLACALGGSSSTELSCKVGLKRQAKKQKPHAMG